MSLFDDIPLPIGTEYFDKKIEDWDPQEQKYFISSSGTHSAKHFPKWLSRELVERHHGESLMSGVEAREAKPGNSYNTRFYRSKT